jgi:hypothetical protein
MKLALERLHETDLHSVEFDPSVYPRTYRTSLGTRISLTFVGLLCIVFGALGAFYFPHDPQIHGRTALILLAGLSVLFAILGAYLIAEIFSMRLTLRSDAIEMKSLTSQRALRREEIAGRRFQPAQYFNVIALLPRDQSQKKLKLMTLFRSDSAFDLWFASIPDLDAKEREQSATQIAEDFDLGATTEDRLARFANAKIIAKTLKVIAGAAAAWGFLYPTPYRAAIVTLVLVPLAALLVLATNKGLYQVEGRKQDARADLSLALILPGAILMLRAIQDVQLLSWSSMLKLSALLTIVLVLVIANCDRQLRARRWPILGFLFVMSAYAIGGLVEANSLFDKGEPQIFRSKVLEKHIATGKTTTCYLRLAPWGPQPRSEEVTVSRSLYGAVSVGDSVCIALRPGALQSPWYVVRRCNYR